MAVIFFDIDGVLNRTGRKPSRKERVVEPQLLERFKQLVKETNAMVVLASTWRHNPGGLQDARYLDIPFDDVLPDLRPQSRAKEVEAWLHRHNHSGRIAIIDDDDDAMAPFRFSSRIPAKACQSRSPRPFVRI